MLMSFLSAQSMLKTRCSVLAWTWQRALPFPPISPSCSEALVGLTTSHGPCCKWLGGPSTSHVQGLCYSGMMTPQPVSWRPVSGKLCSSSGTFVFCSSFCLSLSFNLIFFLCFEYILNLIISQIWSSWLREKCQQVRHKVVHDKWATTVWVAAPEYKITWCGTLLPPLYIPCPLLLLPPSFPPTS